MSVRPQTIWAAWINSNPKIKALLVEKMVTLRKLPQFLIDNKVNQAYVASRESDISKCSAISYSFDAPIHLGILTFIEAPLIKEYAIFIKCFDYFRSLL